MSRFKVVLCLLPFALMLVVVPAPAGPALGKKDKLPDGLTGAKAGDVSAKPKSAGNEEKSLLYVKQVIGVSDDEWPVLKPRVERVLGLLREANAGRDLRPPKTKESKKDAKRTDPPRDPAAAAPQATSQVEERSRDLLQAVADQQVPVGEVRDRIAAIRQARAKARADLTKAQEELRELLTVRQEAVLIVVGVLE
jgi:hypothetical protein